MPILESAVASLAGRRRVGALRRLNRLRNPVWLGARTGRPVSTAWGFDRGDPVDRYYVDRFLARHADDITGRVLEMRDRLYTERWGSQVSASDVLDIDPNIPGVTYVDDLTVGASVPPAFYDCFILTQTLQFLYDVGAAVRTAHRVLAPGGVLLVTVPVTSRMCAVEGFELDFWRFTPASCRAVFGEVFGEEAVTVEAVGNLRTTIAFLRGMSWQELPRKALDEVDPLQPLVVTVRAQKSDNPH